MSIYFDEKTKRYVPYKTTPIAFAWLGGAIIGISIVLVIFW